MDNRDKTPPTSTVEEELSAEEKAIHEQALKQQQSRTSPTPDADLPKVHSESDQ